MLCTVKLVKKKVSYSGVFDLAVQQPQLFRKLHTKTKQWVPVLLNYYRFVLLHVVRARARRTCTVGNTLSTRCLQTCLLQRCSRFRWTRRTLDKPYSVGHARSLVLAFPSLTRFRNLFYRKYPLVLFRSLMRVDGCENSNIFC